MLVPSPLIPIDSLFLVLICSLLQGHITGNGTEEIKQIEQNNISSMTGEKVIVYV